MSGVLSRFAVEGRGETAAQSVLASRAARYEGVGGICKIMLTICLLMLASLDGIAGTGKRPHGAYRR
jgi:hypothetical protein